MIGGCSTIFVFYTLTQIRDIETNELLPPYKEGELCVKGPQVMKGYFKNDQATRETIQDGWLYTGTHKLVGLLGSN